MNHYRSGFVGIIGPPNAGKSSLLNRLVGSKLAIVTPKPQTTRTRILGVYHGEDFQIVFMDTPGIHPTRTLLHKSMVASAISSFQEVDILLLTVSGVSLDEAELSMVFRHLKGISKPCILAINKVDLMNKSALLALMDDITKHHPFQGVVPISALSGDGIDSLLKELLAVLPEGPPFFPPDMNTDQTESNWIAEIIREQVYFHVSKEVPYSCVVTVNDIHPSDRGKMVIAAKIHVESDAQKKILIGHKGEMIKSIGRSARLKIENYLRTGVFLELVVRVEKGWSKDSKALRRLGY